MGDPLGLWMILLATWSVNRTYPGAGAPRGAPTEKALSSWDSAFFLLIPGKIDFFQGDEVGLMFDFMIEEDG